MTPHHHLPDELLSAYATGAAGEAVALFVAAHASLCAPCRARIADEEAIAGALLEAHDARAQPRPDLLARLLPRLDVDAPPDSARPAGDAPLPRDPVLPRAVRRYTGAAPAWRRVVPGLELAELPLKLGDQSVVLTRLAPGTWVPPHTHSGWELQLVLAGGYTADDGRFARGDAHCADAHVTHGFRVDAGEPCISLLVREARIVPRTLLGRLFCWVTGA